MIKRLLFCFLFFVSVQGFSQSNCSLDLVDVPVSCYGQSDGEIKAYASNGTSFSKFRFERYYLGSPFPFGAINCCGPVSLAFPYDSATFISISADTFIIVATEINDSSQNILGGCVMQDTIIVVEPPLLSFSSPAISVDESAPGACDGSISISVAGGAPPYNYSWTGPNGFTSINQSINNLCAGNYQLTVTDTNACTTTLNQTISSPIICDIVVDDVEQVMCPGGSDGSALITIGFASFQIFSWDNLTDGQNYGNGPATTNYNLATGWYRVTGTDTTGSCPPTQSDSFYVAEPMPFIQSAQAVCIGDSVQLSVHIPPATIKPGVDYYFSVNGNPTFYAISSTSSEYLLIGNHYYTLFADTGSGNFSCGSQPDTFLISGINPVNISVDSNLETCRGNDATIIINAVGGGGALNYSIDGGNTFFPNSVFSNLTAGNYNIFVQESGACIQPYANNPVNIGVTPINYVVDSVVAVEESCCGNDGSIQVFTSGTDSSLSYSADSMFTWQDSAKFHFLSEGNYYVVVEDTNGCRTDWGYVGITASSTPDIDMSVHVTDIVCNADTNGTFRVLYPDSCYSYALWRYTISPPYYIPVDTGTYFNGLIAGSYGVIATSNTGNCIDSSLAVVINEPTQLIQNGIAVQEVRCSNNGICDGEITLSAAPTGGTPPYYYSILDYGSNIPYGPISSDSTFSSLCVDSFEVSLFDANACKVIDTVFVADSALYIDSIITTNVSCFGFVDGTAIVYAHGGYTPYSYIWTSGDSSMQTDSLTNMQYSVIVSDAQNCMAFDTIGISQPNKLFFNIKVVDGFKPESCKGVTFDGEFYMNYQGGTAPFNWSWVGTSGNNNSGFGDTIGNLTFDTLTLFVTDANGCVGEPAWIHADSARVDALNALNPLVLDTIIVDSVLCYGSATASIFIDVKSGEEVFSYSIDSGQTFTNASSFINLSEGNYHIEVRDTFGCAVYTQVDIKQAAEIIIFNDSIKHVSCFDGTDGYLSVSAEGGYAPYTYLWDPTSSTTNFTNNLAVGMHTVSITDSAGCSKVDSFSVFELTLPLLSNAVVTANASCNDSANGSATISVQGGMLPYASFWTDTNGLAVNPNTLSAGVYIITINDSFDCGPIYDTVEILEPNPFIIQTTSITANPCFGDALGGLTLSASGGTMPYIEYYARDEQGNTIMVYLPTISGLSASNYDLWAIDASGCPSDTLKGVKVGEPGAIQININNHTNATCYQSDDGALDLYLISGTSPYSYVLSANGNAIAQGNIGQTTSLIFDQLSADQYLLSISDSNSCQKDSLIEIIEPNQVVADFSSDNISGKESFTVSLTNMSQGADIFVWDYDDGNQDILAVNEMPTHTYNKQGQYEIMLIAENSALSSACNDTAFQIIDVQGFDVFNVFTPNDDGLNDVFTFDDWDLSSLYVEIYNRWGERIYHWDAPNGSWNGIAYNGDKAPEGVYYFYLKARGIDGYLYEQEGSITLLR